MYNVCSQFIYITGSFNILDVSNLLETIVSNRNVWVISVIFVDVGTIVW